MPLTIVMRGPSDMIAAFERAGLSPAPVSQPLGPSVTLVSAVAPDSMQTTTATLTMHMVSEFAAAVVRWSSEPSGDDVQSILKVCMGSRSVETPVSSDVRDVAVWVHDAIDAMSIV